MKKNVLKQLVLGVFLLLNYKMLAQSEMQSFKAFGVNPTIPNDSLFKNIKQAKDFKAKYVGIYDLIEFHQQKGNLDSIIHYGHELYAETTNEKLLPKKEEHLSKVSCAIAEGKLEKGLFDEALKWFLKGIEHSKKNFDDELYVKNRIGLGVVKYVRGNEEEGKAIIEECSENAPNEKLKHDAFFEVGFIYYTKDVLEKAKENYNKAKMFYVSEGYLKKALEVDLWLSRILEKEGNIEEALNVCFNVFNESLSNGFYTLYAKTGNVLGGFYLKKKDYDAAKKILSTVYINSIQWGNLDIERRVVLGLQNAYAETGDYKNAHALMTQLNSINHKILTSQNKQQVNELEVQYKTLEQKQEIERQRTIKTNILIGFLIVLIPVLGLLYMYYQKLQTQSKLTKTLEEVSQQKITTLLKNQELKLVKASLEGQNNERQRIARELHDSIGGNLATIKLQLSNDIKPEKENLIQQVDDTYNQVRELSHNLMPKKFKDSAFTSIVSEYIDNVKNLSNEEITLQIHPKEEIDKIEENLKVELYKIIQELLTNALKHAKAAQIDIQLSVFNNSVKLLFEDDGVGFDQEKVKYGLGFQNLKDRLKIIKGEMFINAFPDRGTVIDIDVPLN
ncbi:tetratricopeptide repeat-containing sensor histidine kinase [Tenacibaculum sp. L6]|uniref:tetratricopeptide repeat-containing sensor histidine kinase n=1 Tax=Tenacibaculum sp. L6 TaxID=2992764 RepID=UPI00237A962D|nr:sensor histidine kinase [Tenacibaculum sp. L6]MDE0534933.1 sensor histidine kinase [Tenacibaculum sp. L6]